MKVRYGGLVALMLVAGFTGTAWAQGRVIAGRVTDSTSDTPIIGAQVAVKGTRLSAFTDNRGNYEIGAPVGSAVLTFRAIGYKAAEIDAGPGGGRVNAVLARDVFNLEEVVVTNTTSETRIYGTTNLADTTPTWSLLETFAYQSRRAKLWYSIFPNVVFLMISPAWK